MTFQTHRAPRLAVAPPAARQPGPVTLAIRSLRPNPLPSWEMRHQQIEDERRALRELRERIAGRIEADLAILDALDSDPDFEVEDIEEQHDAENDTRMHGGHGA